MLVLHLQRMFQITACRIIRRIDLNRRSKMLNRFIHFALCHQRQSPTVVRMWQIRFQLQSDLKFMYRFVAQPEFQQRRSQIIVRELVVVRQLDRVPEVFDRPGIVPAIRERQT